VALSLLLDPSGFPRYNAKFVGVPDGLYSHVELYDARPDLSAIGYCYSRMIDVNPSSSVVILHGRQAYGEWQSHKGGTPSKLIGYRFSGYDTLYAAASDSTGIEPRDPFFIAKRVGEKLLVLRRAKAPGRLVDAGLSLDEPSPDTQIQGVTPHAAIPAWALPEVKRLSTAGFEDRWGITEAKLPHDLAIQNVNFFPITQGYDTCMFDADQIFPSVRLGSRHRLLRECVDGIKGFELDGVVFVAPSGWLVTIAHKGEHVGLMWLFPKERN